MTNKYIKESSGKILQNLFKQYLKVTLFFVAGVGLLFLVFSLITWTIKEVKYQREVTDQEHWHGVVTEKQLEKRKISYQCNPRQVSYNSTETYKSGGKTKTRKVTRYITEYDTCYKNVFDTYIKISYGDKIFYDEGIVYDKGFLNNKEPNEFLISDEWKKIEVGMPAAVEKNYKNYLKANRYSIFGQDYSDKIKRTYEKYGKLVPSWPKTYDRFKINQVFQIDNYQDIQPFQKFSEQEMNQFNDKLFQINGNLNNPKNFEDGKIKEVSTIIMFIPDKMDDFYLGIDEKWEGVNKNEIVIYINLSPENHCTRLQVQSWSISKFEIETKLDSFCYGNFGQKSQNKLDFDNMNKLFEEIERQIKTNFSRQEMKEFDYINQENRRNRYI